MSRRGERELPAEPPVASELMIRQKCEAMIYAAYGFLRQFPKYERHVLGAEIRESLCQLLRLIVTCNKRYHKKTTLQDLDVELEVLRSRVRLAHGLGYLDMRRYELWSRMNDEIGRMIGGWVRSVQG
ncbi:diversity-generating retroelement protein Avd [Chrysiogenes arsenatis]|uniref:diversity-generating retroelement protein Avd n=1 Tax=Chrysiogenes arsenatis TaxID=309797 RepID=UPI00040F4AD4|nr:diversity-generating retroelement protein Avd [Chrysiogenes arsenatis]